MAVTISDSLAEFRQEIIQRGLADILSGDGTFPMSITDFPVSQEALDLQKATQEAIIGKGGHCT